jgi:chromosome segregation ATPase
MNLSTYGESPWAHVWKRETGNVSVSRFLNRREVLMPIDAELYESVRAARKQLSDQYGKVKARDVVRIVGRNTSDALQVNSEIALMEQVEEEAAQEKMISKSLREALSKYGEAHANEKCQTLRASIESYQETEVLLRELITDLENSRSEFDQTSETLRQAKANLEKEATKSLGNIEGLDNALNKALQDKTNAENRFAGLKVTVENKSNEIRSGRLQVKKLQKRLDEATRLNDQLQEKVNEMESNLKSTQKQYEDEQEAREKAENLNVKAEVTIIKLKDEIKDLKKQATTTKASANTSTNNK